MVWITSQTPQTAIQTAVYNLQELESEQPGLTHLAQLLWRRIDFAARNPDDRAAWESVQYRVDELDEIEPTHEGRPKRIHLIREALRGAYAIYAQLEHDKASPHFLRGDEEERYTVITA